MAKQIIVLSTAKGPNGTDISVRAAAWFYPAAGREVPLPSASSAFRNATIAEIQAIQARTVIEETYEFLYPSGTGVVAIKADLVSRYNARAAKIAAMTNPNQWYGVYYDGTWSA